MIHKNSKADLLDDVTFIKEIRHLNSGLWQQYDILLASQGYGWDYMISSAAYMSKNDLKDISSITIGTVNGEEKELIDEYRKNHERINQLPELPTEHGSLSVAGISATLSAPVKIVWFNQTKVMRFFTFVDDELLMAKYIETVIRRTFNTTEGMKLAKPIPEKE